MFIKTNENKNRINIPVPIGANQKIGIFFSKQQRTKQLETDNSQLQNKINQALIKFQQQNQHLKQLKTKNSSNLVLLDVLKLQNQMLERQNEKDQYKLKHLETEKVQLNKRQQQFTFQLIEYQKQLFESTKKNEDQLNLLQRYENEIKNQKTLRHAPDSIVNVVLRLEKDLNLLQRNVVIHENKLEGKKKYLNLIEKKQSTEAQKQAEKQAMLKKQTIRSPKKMLNIYGKTSGHVLSPRKNFNYNNQKSIKCRQEQNTAINKQKKRQNYKKYDEMNRKKNAIMLAKTSTKTL